MVKMTEMTQNIPFCTERLKYKLNKPLSVKSEHIWWTWSLKDYTQASKMNKITVVMIENTNTVPGDAVEAT